MAHGVDAAVDAMQAAALEAVLDRPSAEPDVPELPACHDAVLAGGKLGDRRVRRMRWTFPPTVGVFVACVEDPAIVAGDV